MFCRCDYWLTRDDVFESLGRQPIAGYKRIGVVTVELADLVPRGFRPHLDYRRREVPFAEVDPWAAFVVFERERDHSNGHGAARIGVLFVGADAIETFDALYCQETPEAAESDRGAPFGLLLQDHGFGGNWTAFGRGSVLEWLAIAADALPLWTLVGATGTEPWRGYEPATELPHVSAYGDARVLYQRMAAPDIDALRAGAFERGHRFPHRLVASAAWASFEPEHDDPPQGLRFPTAWQG